MSSPAQSRLFLPPPPSLDLPIRERKAIPESKITNPIRLINQEETLDVVSLEGRCTPGFEIKESEDSKKPASSLEEIILPLLGIESLSIADPIISEAFQKTIEALNLQSLSTEKKNQIRDVLTLIQENKEIWKQTPPPKGKFILNDISLVYDRELYAITLTIEKQEIDFDSLFLTNPVKSGLSPEEFYEEHLFIIKHHVRYVKQAKAQERISYSIKHTKAVYLSTKENIGAGKMVRYLKRSLMFTFDNKVIMHLTKKAFTEKIGHGGFKTLSLAVDLKTNEELASASIQLNSRVRRSCFEQEVYWGRHPVIMNHPNCLKIRAVIEYSLQKSAIEKITKARILYPLLKGQDLFYTIEEPTTPLTEAETNFILQELAKIIFDFHSQGIAFKDIKPENFFITRDPTIPREGHNQIKVTALDFGLLQYHTDPTLLTGSELYSAPEYRRHFANHKQYIEPTPLKDIDKKKGDVWALGITFCAILKNTDWAIRGLNAALIAEARKVAEITRLPEKPTDESSIEYIIWRMLQIDPIQRADMTEVVDFLNSITP